MRRLGKFILCLFIISGGLFNVLNAQVKHDTVPLFIADSLNTVYIYADTGKALNRVDKQGRKQGLWEKRYANGNLRYRGHFVDDKPTGIFKYYYDNDSLKALTIYSGDGTVALTHVFHYSGALEAVGKFINQKKDSIWKYYDDMQRMIIKEQYVNGKKEGKSVTFFPNGAVLDMRNWKNDHENGPWQQYYEDGTLDKEGNYADGKMDGPFNGYDENGGIIVKGNYTNDVKNGLWIFYGADGEPKDTLKYRNGNLLNPEKLRISKEKMDAAKQHSQEMEEELENPPMLKDQDEGR